MNSGFRRLATYGIGWIALLGLLGPTVAGPIRSGFSNNPIPANDDASLGPVSLGFDANFFGTTFSSAFVNVNGNLTFDQQLLNHSPFDLTSTGRKIIAPFFADVDTTTGNLVTWGTGTVGGRTAFAATWPGVGFYPSRTDLTNHFQVVLTDRSDTGAGNFDIEFNYDQIQWETGGNSGGVNGLGGASARVGFSDGSGNPETAFELLGSATNGAFLDSGPLGTALALNRLNSTEDGRYVFHSRNGLIDPTNGEPQEEPPPDPDPDPVPDPDPDPDPTESPEPGTLILAGTGLLLLAGSAARRLRRFRKETA